MKGVGNQYVFFGLGMKNLTEKRVEYANYVAGGIVVNPFLCIELTINRKKDTLFHK